MRLARLICDHPLVTSGVMAAAFAGWVVADTALPKPPAPPPATPEVPQVAGFAAWREAFPRLSPQEQEQLRTARLLRRLPVGMPRAEAEAYLQQPPGWVGADGRARCTVLLLRPLPGTDGPTGLCDVVLVFDTSRPEQPFDQFVCTPHVPAR
jgi:hypothetical protein